MLRASSRMVCVEFYVNLWEGMGPEGMGFYVNLLPFKVQ